MIIIVCDACGKHGEVGRSSREGERCWPPDWRSDSLHSESPRRIHGGPSEHDPLLLRVRYEACSEKCEQVLLRRVPARTIVTVETKPA